VATVKPIGLGDDVGVADPRSPAGQRHVAGGPAGLAGRIAGEGGLAGLERRRQGVLQLVGGLADRGHLLAGDLLEALHGGLEGALRAEVPDPPGLEALGGPGGLDLAQGAGADSLDVVQQRHGALPRDPASCERAV
jgi:hypothetical protein